MKPFTVYTYFKSIEQKDKTTTETKKKKKKINKSILVKPSPSVGGSGVYNKCVLFPYTHIQCLYFFFHFISYLYLLPLLVGEYLYSFHLFEYTHILYAHFNKHNDIYRNMYASITCLLFDSFL